MKTTLPKEGNVKIFVCGYVPFLPPTLGVCPWVALFAHRVVADGRPPAMYKAVSGGKKSPTDQGELSGILEKLGYSKDQVNITCTYLKC